ncbi:hypothetical protein, partial [Lactococcus lactis]|uniref:hypothetical protein n=1 Tax=Lactococcus lactis TaxID=1358 RepID=UPI00288CF537
SSFLLLSFSIILPYLIVDLKLCNRTDDSVWSNSNYENETSQDDLARLERVKLEALAKINSKAT